MGAWNGGWLLGCGNLPATGADSIWGLAGISGGPWIPHAPTFHLAGQTMKW